MYGYTRLPWSCGVEEEEKLLTRHCFFFVSLAFITLINSSSTKQTDNWPSDQGHLWGQGYPRFASCVSRSFGKPRPSTNLFDSTACFSMQVAAFTSLAAKSGERKLLSACVAVNKGSRLLLR